jgi:GNAT superfamily N-acetyltransferase
MGKPSNALYVDDGLHAGWLAARSIARGLPQPVAEHGGLRVDTGSPSELRRYVFAGPVREIRQLALSITTPHVFIKMCGPGEQLLALMPPGWQLQPAGYLMTHAGGFDAPVLPAGYRLEVSTEQLTTVACIRAEDGAVAASGYAAEYAGVFVFDRIVTEPAHRRRGLGRALMAALGAAQRSSTARRVLVATEEGRALYASLGWVVHSPYSTVTMAASAADA